MSDKMHRTEFRHGVGGRAVHDVGGLDFGPIDRTEHDLALGEKRVDAMLILLVSPSKGAFKIDALRRVIEDYGQQTYDVTAYYEKWICAIRNLLIEQEIVTRPELEAKLAAVRGALRARGRPIEDSDVPWDTEAT
jgi:hypothetical protein